jgi:hypothetical protein
MSSCVNLTYIHSFSEASSLTLRKYHDIGFSATQYCHDMICLDPASYISGTIQKAANCDCKDFVGADKAIRVVNDILCSYWDGLKDLSDKKVVNVSSTNLASSVSTLSANMKLGMNAEEVRAARDVFSLVSSSLLSGWRRNKLKEIVGQSNTPLVVIMAAQRRNISALRKILEEERLELRAAYGAMTDKASESQLRFLLNTELARRDSALLKQDRLLANFYNSLVKIREGHETLYAERQKLRDPEFIKSILASTSAISDLLQEFNDMEK